MPVMGGFEGGSAKTLRRRLESTEACTTAERRDTLPPLEGPGGNGSGRHRHPTRAPLMPWMDALSRCLTGIDIQ